MDERGCGKRGKGEERIGDGDWSEGFDFRAQVGIKYNHREEDYRGNQAHLGGGGGGVEKSAKKGRWN